MLKYVRKIVIFSSHQGDRTVRPNAVRTFDMGYRWIQRIWHSVHVFVDDFSTKGAYGSSVIRLTSSVLIN